MRLPISLADRLSEILADWQTQKTRFISPPVRRVRAVASASRRLPLYSHAVAAGLPAPATEYVEDELDLNEYLTPHPEASFCVRASGDSMLRAGIHPGDLLVVDTKMTAEDGKIVIAVVDGELTVKRIALEGDRVLLVPENTAYQPLVVTEDMDFRVLGVVTNVIHPLA
jgi:DNA polymerase V